MSITAELETAIDAPVVTLTEAAVKHIRFLRNRKGDATLGVRIGVKGGGCSGLSYVLGLEPAPRETDNILEFEDVRVFVDPRSAKFLQGTTLDYSTRNLIEGGWRFTNPNASRTCGCGTSFQPTSPK